jgi:hypothetical protein
VREIGHALVSTLAVALLACSARRPGPAPVRERGVSERLPARDRASPPATSALVSESAAFLACLALPPSSPLRDLAASSPYREHCAKLTSGWRAYEETQLRKIEAWRALHLRDEAPQGIFYPMSGPDLVNALALFPRARDYLLIGLEPPGPLPLVRHLPRAELSTWLEESRAVLRTLLRKNLFRSGEMKADMRRSPLASVPALLLLFLARTGHELGEARGLAVDSEGRVAPASGEARRPGQFAGVELLFRRRGEGPWRRVRYVRMDLSDQTQAPRPRLLDALLPRGEVATLLKAASYLPGQTDFSALRTTVLERSRLVIEDDSGIPIRHFAARDWRLQLFGTYRVIRRFAHKHQPDLETAMRARSSGPLPFAYGYGFSPESSHLIVARRR